MRIILLISLIITSTCFLSGCFIHSRKGEYLQAKSEGDLVVPAQLSNAKVQDARPIPKGVVWNPTKSISYLPPDSVLTKWVTIKKAQTKVVYHVTELGTGQQGNAALLVRKPFAQVWPLMRKGLDNLNYHFVGSDKTLGSYVVSNRAKTMAYKFNLWQVKAGVAIDIQRYPNGLISQKQASKILMALQKQFNELINK